jgi:hypothetical protein
MPTNAIDAGDLFVANSTAVHYVHRASRFWDSMLDEFIIGDDQRERLMNSALLYFRPPFVLLLFGGLWGLCVLYFERNTINYTLVLRMKKHEITRPAQLLRAILFLCGLVFICFFGYLGLAGSGLAHRGACYLWLYLTVQWAF